MKRVRILRDTSGASVVIALVFFLICGIIGSVVMTAASVQGQAGQTPGADARGLAAERVRDAVGGEADGPAAGRRGCCLGGEIGSR